MKINLPTGLLALSAVVVVAYFTLPTQAEQHSTRITKAEQTGSEKIALAKTKEFPSNQAEPVWQPIAEQQRPQMLPDNLNVEYVKVADNNPKNFSEGQKVSFLIPQEDKSYVGTVNESTRAFGGDVKISAGDIENGSEFASFSITEGENTTFVTVATGESIYQVEIDNHSGVGVVLDDRELNQYRHNEDGILPPPEGVS